MSRPFRLQTILDLAERDADQSAARLGALNLQVQQVEAKLNLLLQYREDYLTRFRNGMRQDPHSSGWRGFHEFMDKLDAAITQQRAIVGQAHELVRRGQAEHRDRQRKVKAFDTLADRHHEAEVKRENRAEQRVFDELAGTAAFRRSQPA